MADNFVTVAPASTAPLALPVATKQLDDAAHAGVTVIVDKDGARARTLVITTAGAARVEPAVAASATLSNVASSATNVTLLASNANRKGAAIYNDSTSILYVKFGATASATSFVVAMAASSYYEFPQPVFTGVVDGIWASAQGSARLTEIA